MKDEVNPAFNNNQYWLVFPFSTSTGTPPPTPGIRASKSLPTGKGTTNQVVGSYAAEVRRYTPGDTWTLFVGPDKRVKEFIYHRGGSVKPTVVAHHVGRLPDGRPSACLHRPPRDSRRRTGPDFLFPMWPSRRRVQATGGARSKTAKNRAAPRS